MRNTKDMKKNKDNWIKAWDKESNKLLKYLHGNECLPANFDEVVIKFISQVEKDAIEKTNKRWRERITKLSKSYYILGVASTAVDGDADPNSDYNMGYKDGANNKDREWKDKISDLLEDKHEDS